MKAKARLTMLWYGGSVLLVATVGLWEVLIYNQLEPADRQQVAALIFPYQFFMVAPLVLLVVVLISGSKWLLDRFWIPLAQLREEAQILSSGNLRHRVEPHGANTVSNLARHINRLAEQTAAAQEQVQEQISHAKAEVEREKNVLAMLIEELQEGIVVCNRDGVVLLYNRAAKTMLNPAAGSENNSALLGLGKQIQNTLQAPLLDYTLHDLRERQQMGNSSLVQPFMLWQGAHLLRVQLLGLLGQDHDLSGFILVCEDQTPRPQANHPLNMLQQETIEQRRAAIANIRASVETMLDYPDMPAQQQHALLEMIQSQTVQLTDLLSERHLHTSRELKHLCPLTSTSIHDWLTDLYRHSDPSAKYHIRYQAEEQPDQFADLNRFLLNKGLYFLFEQLQQTLGLDIIEIRRAPFAPSGGAAADSDFAVVDLTWEGEPLAADQLRSWLEYPIRAEAADSTITLSEVCRRHDVEIWLEGSSDTQQHYLRLLFPAVERPTAGVTTSHVYLGGRPIFYDFDLFDKELADPELAHARLADVSYTVFDTETTGLNPSGGDEIISIGAMHIVNGKLLENETFEQLIDPRREISPASIEIHGIQPSMLAGQPTIDKVLPQFYQFTENSVLLAHNAAFDMRFLQLKERKTGVKFRNPVLDTLLLSAVVHPNQEMHDLESISRRLNLRIEGRHTALGDARVTGQIMLHLIPMLAEKGIHTIQEAQEASRQTYYAKAQY
jgi:DNA polymerase-3 subunit epsilon